MNSPAATGTTPTVGRILRALARRLQHTGQTDAASLAEWALASILNVRPLDVYVQARESLSPQQQEKLSLLADRLARHEPIQYVLGHTDFMGRRFHTDARALIPRPETEQLVDLAILDPVVSECASPRMADVGTGSGIVAISLALTLPHARILATDVDAKALRLARENARLHRVASHIEWRQADLLSDARDGKLDAIVANLPYVATDELDRLELRVRAFEPRVALDGGHNGMERISRLSGQAVRALRPGGVLLLEIGEDQGAAIQALWARLGFESFRLHQDLAGHDRVARAIAPAPSAP